jgi:hypothetical protein
VTVSEGRMRPVGDGNKYVIRTHIFLVVSEGRMRPVGDGNLQKAVGMQKMRRSLKGGCGPSGMETLRCRRSHAEASGV